MNKHKVSSFKTLGFFMLCRSCYQNEHGYTQKKEIYALNDLKGELCFMECDPLQPSTRLQVVFLWRFQHGAC
jgi:hypothetical protein